MVSFSCEVCNDTLVKRKLIPHFNRCPNAYFTCIDCNTTFQGDEFQGHTSCISEDQKYQGKLYKGKPAPATPQPAKESEPKPKAAKKSDKSEPKTKKQKLASTKPEKIEINSTQSLYKVLKGLKKTHKMDTKQLLKKINITPDGQLELA